MHYLGEEGYMRLAAETYETARKLVDGVNAIDGVHIWGEPDMTVAAIGSREHDIFAIGDVLNQRGWHFDRQENPNALHLMASPRHKLNIDEFLADLRDAVATNAGSSTTAASYGDDVSAEASAR
jgi:glutamate/tyrosine decarboxylase-like PLP-dependent enzyme